jgi:hypothetical protein
VQEPDSSKVKFSEKLVSLKRDIEKLKSENEKSYSAFKKFKDEKEAREEALKKKKFIMMKVNLGEAY